MAAASTTTESPTTTTPRPERIDRIRLSSTNFGFPSPFGYVRGPGLVNVLFAFDTLLWKDGTGDVIPWLATDWQQSDDGLVWSFDLDPKAAWHDGTPVTAADVVFSFEYRISGAGSTAPGITGNFDMIESVEATGGNSVTFTLARPYAPFEVLIAGRVPIIPRHIWSDVADPGKFREPTASIGSGPYLVDSVDETAGSVRFVANENHHLGVPYVRSIEFVRVNDAVLALEQGVIDVGSPGNEDGLPAGSLDPFQEPEWGRLVEPGEWNRALHINLTRGFPYDDVRFRRALAHAIDREDLITRILLGAGEVGSFGGLAPSHPLVAPGLATYDADTAQANALLDELGLVDADGDGIRDLPDGTAFRPELQTSNRFTPTTATLIKEYLARVGLEIEVAALDSNTADDAAANAAYDLALVGYGGMGGDPDGLRTRYSSRVRGTSFSRVHGWVNEDFEQAASQQLSARTPDARRQAVHAMQRAIANDVPAISLYVPARILLFRNDQLDSWYYTPGGVFGGYPGPLNKHVFVTGKRAGR